MHKGQYVFTQVCSFLPKNRFDWLVKKYEGNRYVKHFTCWHHLLVMVFGQLSNRESLRDLTTTLSCHKSKFYHLGFGDNVSRSNLSKANEIREVRIFEDFANLIIAEAREKRSGSCDFFIDGDVYAFDSSTIPLCLNTFWWTRLHHGKGGVKLHTLYDVKTDIPAFNIITDASPHDSTVMHNIPYKPGAYYIFDRAYMVTKELYQIHLQESFFVVREKHKLKYQVVNDKEYENTQNGIMADQTICFDGQNTKKQYPAQLRRVVFYDKDGNRTFVFYTNNFELPAEYIALLYKYRWRVELFYKWMKQHLRINEFYGTSENAVKIQIYCAIIAYCLIAIIESDLKLEMSIYDVLRILNVSLFDKSRLRGLFEGMKEEVNYQNDTQLKLIFLVDTSETIYKRLITKK
jgi:hypothetical protein